MIVIWSGWGFLVAVIGLVLWGAGYGLGAVVAPGMPLAAGVGGFLGAMGAAVAIFYFARAIESKPGRTLIDAKTGEQVVIRNSAGSLFFIPTRYWTYIVPVLGIGLSVAMMTPTK